MNFQNYLEVEGCFSSWILEETQDLWIFMSLCSYNNMKIYSSLVSLVQIKSEIKKI